MTEVEWQNCNDAGKMLDFLWQQQEFCPDTLERVNDAYDTTALQRAIQRFELATCRKIWKLLPQEASRRGVELAEQWIAGQISWEELVLAEWKAEGAAFRIEYQWYPDSWQDDVRAIPRDELQSMFYPPTLTDTITPHEMLLRAAYFVDRAMISPTYAPKGPIGEFYHTFLSAELLRQFVEYPKLVI